MSFRFCRDKQLYTLADAKGNYSFKMHLLPSQHFIYILLLAQGGSKEHSEKEVCGSSWKSLAALLIQKKFSHYFPCNLSAFLGD